MAQAEGAAAPENPARKRLKFSDIPLSQAQRSAVDNLVHTFKKKGEFDRLRKQAYSLFDQGVRAHTQITSHQLHSF